MDSSVLIPEPREVLDYLARYPDLVEPLPRICQRVRAQLPADIQLSLELYRDRESEDSYLTLYARQATYDHALLDRLEAASTEFEADLQVRSGWLLLTTDFRRPA
jgi:hypothetical protein